MPGAFTGALVRRYTVDISALPGYITTDRHDADLDDSSPDDNRDRAQAPAGGGWVPEDWLSGQVSVGTGEMVRDRQRDDTDDHRASNRHAGQDAGGFPRGPGQDDEAPARQRRNAHAPATLDTAGSAGAAFGGQRKTGSMAPEANPEGVDLGHTYVPVHDEHKQGLHFNRPGLRLIRSPNRTSGEYVAYAAGAGPSAPRLRRQIRPAGQAEFLPIDQSPDSSTATLEREHGSIGGEWAL